MPNSRRKFFTLWLLANTLSAVLPPLIYSVAISFSLAGVVYTSVTGL